MYLRLLTGRYAGEVRDLAPAAARVMLESGRAEDPRDTPATPAVPAAAPKSAPAAKKAARK